jgi:nitroreductase
MTHSSTNMETIRRRSSCRSYDGRVLSAEDRQELERRIATGIANPFGAVVRLPLLENDRLAGKKLGTYGVIHGAGLYMAGVVKAGNLDTEGLGYAMEHAVLEATAMGLGTCWLAGTYNRNDFKDSARLAGDERIVCVSPVGYPAERRTLLDSMMRGVAGSAKRKPWNELFFDGSLSTLFTEQAAGEYRDALEAVRLAPSGSNGQPWRVVRQGSAFHFYRAVKAGSDYGRVDMGIAACHFELVAKDKNIIGKWILSDPDLKLESDAMTYFASWVI